MYFDPPLLLSQLLPVGVIRFTSSLSFVPWFCLSQGGGMAEILHAMVTAAVEWMRLGLPLQQLHIVLYSRDMRLDKQDKNCLEIFKRLKKKTEAKKVIPPVKLFGHTHCSNTNYYYWGLPKEYWKSKLFSVSGAGFPQNLKPKLHLNMEETMVAKVINGLKSLRFFWKGAAGC